jgi:hypothetical protein
MTRFFTEGPACRAYIRCRDLARLSGVRERIEEFWAQYQPYCGDKHFLAEARTKYLERTWEMYLACTLLRFGFRLRPARGTGPDICIDSDPPIWIEAVAASAGSGPDQVPGRDRRGRTTNLGPGMKMWQGQPPTEESLILRCTHVLGEKRAKREGYVKTGLVRDDSPYIVAINLAGIDGAEDASEDDDPIIIKALFGIGEDYLEVRLSDGTVKHGVAARPAVTKKSGAAVSAMSFANQSCADVSGVFCSSSTISSSVEDMGSDLIYVHNPHAAHGVPQRTFRFGTEFMLSSGNFVRQRWSRPT